MTPSSRRSFLATLATAPVAAHLAAPEAAAAQALPANASDADVFAAARKQFLMPVDVTYCNTGTLGAIPRPVVDAMNQGVEKLERELPDWPYFQADGEPLTG